ncbi:bifunctional phosphoribosylaminoimidazolecarboxamide formyltransferase/IMP cyclohydrolase [Pseudothermotoga sp. U03pept]|uniref:bifunctional phosphoribosylaminoimidazolecarboxamide formyltransferase/IMP cyclohydrolase n=1 Tax=Pseudothermotoga sp. U03pept TaxID=3447012 RepID=UPI003F03EDE5
MRALISVSNKEGVVDLAKALHKLNVQIISTGGTAKHLKENSIEVIEVSQLTSSPEILDGRVKTLHPSIHGAILAKRDNLEHLEELKRLSITPIDIVVVNLYPFKETVLKTIDIEEIVENIDIGGPTLLRAAAKNFKDVIVICDVNDYHWLVEKLSKGESITLNERMKLALKAFRHTAHYDALICEYFSKLVCDEDLPQTFTKSFEKLFDLRYGENPHQKAALYRNPFCKISGIVNAEQLQGKELSYNNICDADAALSLVCEFDEPCAVAVKHTNPCGVSCDKEILKAFEKAYQADPISIFGGIVAFNRTVDEKVAQRLSEIFLEVLLAPEYTQEALKVLSKKKNLRVLKVKMNNEGDQIEIRTVSGGILVQTKDDKDFEQLTVVTKRKPTENEMKDLLFAWKVVKHVKSNAIVLAKELTTLGIGSGQVNRLWPTEHCVRVAGENAKGAVLASDAFFPFPDAVEVAAKAGVTAVIQPGGSLRDEQVIQIADRYNIAMIFTGTRHFKH